MRGNPIDGEDTVALSPYEAVVGLLRHFPGKTFPNDRPKFHTALTRLQEQFPTALCRIRFWPHGPFPKSKEVDDAFDALFGNVLTTRSPRMDTWYIDKAGAERLWTQVLGWEANDGTFRTMAAALARILDE